MTCTIDIGDKHTALCFQKDDRTGKSPYCIYLFSALDSDINKKMKSIRKHLDKIFKSIGIYTKKVIIEKQMNQARRNVSSEFAVIMYLSILGEKYGFQIEEQHPQKKYKILGKHKGQNNKVLGSQYVAENFIDKDNVIICYQSDFGKDGCKRRKDGSVPRCRWYSDKTYEFCVNNDLDKLDDLADTILMQLV